MTLPPFQIECNYNSVAYIGLVYPIVEAGDVSYEVHLESENQEVSMDILLNPSMSNLEDWDYFCGDGVSAVKFYERQLLEEVGEQIEAKLTNKGNSAQII